MKTKKRFSISKAGVLSLCIAAVVAQAQDSSDSLEEIVITGYRGSLIDSTAAKRDSNGFSDEIFSDDIGKLPSQNLAESLNRIPGVKINREVTGEGLQIAVRGLGPSFTKVVLNGNNIAIASDGSLDSGNRNREVDLGVFPTEFFSSLSVSKSANAQQLEGGTSGFVNMRTARAFDNEEQRFNFSVEGGYSEINEEISPKLAFTYSNTWDEKFGVLVGVVSSNKKSRVDGYETIGYTDGCLVAAADPLVPDNRTCVDGSLGRNHIDWNPTATQDYVDVYNGNVGDELDLVETSGVSAAMLDRGIFPYLGRGTLVEGDRDSLAGLVSFEYRPNEDMSFVFDIMNSQASRDFNRVNLMLYARRTRFNNGDAMIPVDLEVDSNEVIRQATLFNSSYFVEARDYKEDLSFESYMPSFSWQINPLLQMDIAASYTRSEFDREMPTWLYQTPKGVTQYSLSADVPAFDVSYDVNDPNIGWQWYNFTSAARFVLDKRDTETTGLHADFKLGEDADRNGFKFGFSYDEASRNMKSFGNGGEHNDAVLAAVPDGAALAQYLRPMSGADFGSSMDGNLGYNGFAQLNYDALKSSYDYAGIVAGATQSGGDAFGQTVGDISEEYLALYLEANAVAEILDRELRMNLGTRWVQTDQTMGSYDTASESTLTTNTSYDQWLPSFSAVYDLNSDIKLRASASRTMTRASPADMFPNAAWGSVGIDTANAGNPELSPYFGDNVDFGGEWYFSDMGYLGLTFFNKRITGFTRQDKVDVPFTELDELGLDTANLDPYRQEELDACGGPDICTTEVTTRINVEGSVDLAGFEAVWVQPLDMLVNGLGFNVSATNIDQSSSSPEAEVTGISDWTYNMTGFYENNSFQVRLTYFHQDEAVTGGPQGGYDGNPLPLRLPIALARSQLDLAASYRLPFSMPGDGEISLTFDAYNISNEPVGTWYGHQGVPSSIYYPGATYTFGIRGSF